MSLKDKRIVRQEQSININKEWRLLKYNKFKKKDKGRNRDKGSLREIKRRKSKVRSPKENYRPLNLIR